MVSEYELIDILGTEAKSDVVPLHPQLGLLVQAFIRYLKEPRFQSPLTIIELSELFRKFYQDLNTLTINVYSQSNSNKKQLISNSQHLKSCPELFDYLLAIANYSSSSIKLVKRTDPSALLQLRIFNFYKFIITFESIEKALNMLFNSVNNNHEDVKLFDKIFRFDERDLIIQEFLDQKLLTLRKLKLSIDSFIESSPVSNKVNDLDLLNNKTITQIHHTFLDINNQITPFAKLKVVVEVQKRLISFLSDHLDTEINNDILLPIFIYLTIYKFSNDSSNKDSDLYLNFNFIKNFVNLIDPDNIPLVPNSNSVSFGSYNPDTCTIFTHNTTKQIPHKLISLFECLNLNTDDSNDTESDIFFNSDKDLINFMQSHYLNNSELNYYLTNFEAVLFFIQSVTIDELSNVVKTNNPILLKPINKLVDEELMNQFRFPPGKAETKEPVEDQGQDSERSLKTPTLDTSTAQPNRSRSSSLFNTITNRLNDAATSVNRSRSNSALFNRKDSNGGEFSLYPSPIIPNDGSGDSSTNLNMMRNILGRFGLVSLRPSESQYDEETGIIDEDGTSGGGTINGTNGANGTTNTTTTTTASEEPNSKGIDRLSPHHSLTRSSSLETQNISPNRKNTIASRLSTGVNEIMTKFNTPNNNIIINPVNNSTSSLKSIEEMDDQIGENVNQEKRPEYLRSRTTSLQVMEKWFNNLASNPQQKQIQTQQHQQQHQNQPPQIPPVKGDDYISDSRTGSVFSTTSKELTKYHNVDFDCLTVLDLRTLKLYYDQLCNEVGVKLETKTSEEISHDQISTNSI